MIMEQVISGPDYFKKQVLSDAGLTRGQSYYAFPSILKKNDSSVLIAYKHGTAHWNDDSALEVIEFHTVRKEVISKQVLANVPGQVQANAEIMRMPDGAIIIYEDVQLSGVKNATKATRLGLQTYVSTDQGKSFQCTGALPHVGGYEFGYAFDDAILPDGSVVMLVMSFPELAGGKRNVHVIRLTNGERDWTYVKNLSDEFQCKFNESSFLRWRNGYVFVTRGDDKITRIFRTDHQFNLIGGKNVTEQYPSINHVGRPKCFIEDDIYYFISRHVIEKPERCFLLQLFQFNPETLEIESTVILDSHRGDSYFVGDSYYAESYLQEEAGQIMFNVITYMPKSPGATPDIVRLEYDWDELKRCLQQNRGVFSN